jgi:Arc/MetJ-type ribon-helix-helix transcriptional regulator
MTGIRVGSLSETLSIRIPKHTAEATDFLIQSRVHRNRAEVIRAALDNYLAFFQTAEGDRFLDGIEKFRRLMLKRLKSESVERWITEIQPMLERAMVAKDWALVQEIIDTCASAFRDLPTAYRTSIRMEFEENVIWKLAAEKAGRTLFWQYDPEGPATTL